MYTYIQELYDNWNVLRKLDSDVEIYIIHVHIPMILSKNKHPMLANLAQRMSHIKIEEPVERAHYEAYVLINNTINYLYTNYGYFELTSDFLDEQFGHVLKVLMTILKRHADPPLDMAQSLVIEYFDTIINALSPQ